jgi:hypothetical protein
MSGAGPSPVRTAGSTDKQTLRARVGLPAYGLDALLPHLGSEWNRTVRVAELDAARLGGRESRLGAFRDLGALLLGDRRD